MSAETFGNISWTVAQVLSIPNYMNQKSHIFLVLRQLSIAARIVFIQSSYILDKLIKLCG